MSRLYGVGSRGLGGRDKDNKLDNNKYEGTPSPRRHHTLMHAEDIQSGKKSKWTELEIKVNYRLVES